MKSEIQVSNKNSKSEIRNSKSEIRNKFEIRNSKQIRILNNQNLEKEFPYKYDLEERTFDFAKRVRIFVKKLPKAIGNMEDGSQLVRSSGSPGANYIEANEALGKKDFLLRIKICRKECKESRYWLSLIDVGSNLDLESERQILIKEATELMLIFGSIYRKSV